MNNNDYQELSKHKSLTSNNFNVNRTNSIDGQQSNDYGLRSSYATP